MYIDMEIKKIVVLLSILPVFFLFGCVSTSDYEKLKLDFEQLKYESEKKYSSLNNDMEMFKDAYNPELQKSFSSNVMAAEKYRQSVEGIKYDMENISNRINALLRESENDRMLISENLRTSAAENVVNEFRQLRNQWDATIFELSNLIRNSEKAADSSRRAAMKAAEKAGMAERSAEHVDGFINIINEQTRSLNKIQEKIKDMDSKIRKINRQLNNNDEPKKDTGREK